MGPRGNRLSRCSNKESAPYTWFDHTDENHPAVRKLEDWLQSLSFFAEQNERGRIDNLFDKASKGELWDSNDGATPLKPITSDPDLFELRHKAFTVMMRFYHAEPEHYPQLLIALHRHIKVDGASQQREIDFAIERYRTQSS